MSCAQCEKAAARLATILEAAAPLLECRVIHQGYPDGTTCLDMIEYARANNNCVNDSGYTPEYRDRILAGKELCDHCRLRHAVESTKPG